jgi:hypothetical protein
VRKRSKAAISIFRASAIVLRCQQQETNKHSINLITIGHTSTSNQTVDQQPAARSQLFIVLPFASAQNFLSIRFFRVEFANRSCLGHRQLESNFSPRIGSASMIFHFSAALCGAFFWARPAFALRASVKSSLAPQQPLLAAVD